MRRAGALRLRAPILACLVAGVLAGCGGDKRSSGSGGLTFEQLADTVGLADGPAILDSLVVERMTGGSLRVRSRSRLPDGTRVRIAIKPAGSRSAIAMSQVEVRGGSIETPPLMAPSGPLPVGRYRVEISAQFAPDWQPPAVLRATDDGRALRGPGITRTRTGRAMFWQARETTV